MNKIIYLKRNDYNENGIFGILADENHIQIAVTLEHSYDSEPKLTNGSYMCVKGQHTLEHTPVPFQAFEITQVPLHTNILIHVGNYNKDSEGCVLIGKERVDDMITHSRDAFHEFMDSMAGVSTFTLVVS